MRYIEYIEHREHGTKDFPFAYYDVNEKHPRYQMPYHWHQQYEIIHVFNGSLNLLINNKTYTMEKDDTAFVESGALHGGTPDYCHYACIVFDFDSLLANLAWARDIYMNLISYSLHFNDYYNSKFTDICTHVENMCNALSQKQNGYRMTVIGSLFQLIGILLQNKQYSDKTRVSNTQSKKIAKLKSVLSYIAMHYMENISLADMAGCIDMSTNYFCKFFYEIMHTTPIEYLNYYRIEIACEQLIITNKNITDIAYDCGFNDVSYFTKVFKKYKDTVPSKYMELNYR